MRNLILAITILLLMGCTHQSSRRASDSFTTDVINKYTPVKNQGHSTFCWAYAMAAAIETEHIMRGDSVNLSVAYVVRNMMTDLYQRYYLSQGSVPFTTRGTGHTFINLIQQYGAMPYDAYPGNDNANINVLRNRIKMVSKASLRMRAGLDKNNGDISMILDDVLGPCPLHVFMLGAEYTPIEFAHSVCAPDEYIAVSSVKHHPYYERFILEVPDNWERNTFYNVPIDTMLQHVDAAVRNGHGVCWEGDVSESGFSMYSGTATVPALPKGNIDDARQRLYERFATTDDHCMAIVGIAHDKYGKPYFIMKNSYGTQRSYKGLMYMSYEYFKLKTLAVYLTREAYVKNHFGRKGKRLL